jgi:hypothetical protein
MARNSVVERLATPPANALSKRMLDRNLTQRNEE